MGYEGERREAYESEGKGVRMRSFMERCHSWSEIGELGSVRTWTGAVKGVYVIAEMLVGEGGTGVD